MTSDALPGGEKNRAAVDATPTILFVGTFLANAGKNRGVSAALADRLAHQKWNVLATSQKPGRIPRLLDMLWTTWRQREAFEVAHIDVYSGPAFMWAEATASVLKLLGKPFVLTLRGGDLPRFSTRWPGRMRRLLHSAALVTSPSQYLLEAMPAYHSDLRLLPNPLDLNSYAFHVRRTPQPHLIWLRAFHAIYNPALGPHVLANLLPECPDVCLTMVGPDKGDGSLQETRRVAAQLGLLDRIHFPGGVPKKEVPKWLNEGDIFINTTNTDNTPVSVIEGMACGLCVVSTDVGGIPYLLEHGSDALLVPPDDPDAMARAVRRTLTEPGLSEDLSRNGRKKAEQFDWSVILPQWEAIFREAMGSVGV